MRVSYGQEDAEYNKKLVDLAGSLARDLMEYTTPGRLLVGAFHSLRFVPSWFPGAGWKRALEAMAATNIKLTTMPFNDTKDRIVSVQTPLSVLRYRLRTWAPCSTKANHRRMRMLQRTLLRSCRKRATLITLDSKRSLSMSPLYLISVSLHRSKVAPSSRTYTTLTAGADTVSPLSHNFSQVD